MKPFNLKEYLADTSRKVITRTGRPVRILCTDAMGDCPVVGLINYNDEAYIPETYTENGSCYSDNEESSRDLFFDVEKKERFDTKTLQPFDKVLVKNDDDLTWVTALFSHLVKTHDEVTGIDHLDSVTSYCTTSFCIPYNDDTKHLVGTTKEAPKYYRHWDD